MCLREDPDRPLWAYWGNLASSWSLRAAGRKLSAATAGDWDKKLITLRSFPRASLRVPLQELQTSIRKNPEVL
jgi:hypothetical protein